MENRTTRFRSTQLRSSSSRYLRWCRVCGLFPPRVEFPLRGSVCVGCLAHPERRAPAQVEHRHRPDPAGRKAEPTVKPRSTPGAQAYQAWIREVEGRLADLPGPWQQVWKKLDRPNLHAMAQSLGRHEESFRQSWLAKGLPMPPRGSGLIKF